MFSEPGAKVAAACVELIGPPDEYVAPAGYDGLALAVMDAIWSLGVRYRGVGNVLDRYRAWVRSNWGVAADTRTSRDLLDDISYVGGAGAFARDVACNRQLTSRRGGVLKAAAIAEACESLVHCGVLTADDLRGRAGDESVKTTWLAVHGQASGISWHYVLMNVRVDDVKPDRMVRRFVAAALDRPSVSPGMAHDEVVAAHKLLLTRYLDVSLRALDHAIWKYERKRRA